LEKQPHCMRSLASGKRPSLYVSTDERTIFPGGGPRVLITHRDQVIHGNKRPWVPGNHNQNHPKTTKKHKNKKKKQPESEEFKRSGTKVRRRIQERHIPQWAQRPTNGTANGRVRPFVCELQNTADGERPHGQENLVRGESGLKHKPKGRDRTQLSFQFFIRREESKVGGGRGSARRLIPASAPRLWGFQGHRKPCIFDVASTKQSFASKRLPGRNDSVNVGISHHDVADVILRQLSLRCKMGGLGCSPWSGD